jgi:serine protease Do
MRKHPSLLTAVGLALLGAWAALPRSTGASPDGPPAVNTIGPAPTARSSWSLRQTPVVEAVRRVKDSVVNIHSERHAKAGGPDELFTLAPSQSRVNGMGTGIVIDSRGYIITNQHVVEDVSLIRVKLSDGTSVSARILVRDPESDLALIKINAPRPLPVMPLGTARDLMVGETVVAVGNAYGYDHTVSVGVVSATGRDVTLNKDVRYLSLIQTDAAINPGNSGGPLLNIQGELVGVNVAIRAGAQGIGFAIPVDTMIRVGADMLARVQRRPTPAGLGLVLRDDCRAGNDRTIRQVVVERVEPGSIAGRAGIKPGDVLTRVEGHTVTSSLDIPRAMLAHFEKSESEKLAVQVVRGGAVQRLELALAGGGDHALAGGIGNNAEQVWQKLGLRLRPVSAAALGRNHPQLNGGLAIADVRPDSPASKAGLKFGDVLVGLHQWEMITLDNVVYVLNHSDRATFSPLRFYILRGGQVHRGSLTLPD